MTHSSPMNPERRWHQFSLGTLLIAVTLFTAIFGWVGARVYWARENRNRVAAVEDAVALIERRHGQFTSERVELRTQTWLEGLFDDPGGSDDPVRALKVTQVSFWGRTSFTDDDLMQLQVLRSLQSLNLAGTSVTDSGLVYLNGLKNLESIDLSVTDVTDAGMDQIRVLTNLKKVALVYTSITDAGLERLKELTNLEYLALGETKVSDAGLRHLIELKNLRRLNLSETAVTDAGLMHLTGLKRLKRLNVMDTKVTDEGVEILQQALPACDIWH